MTTTTDPQDRIEFDGMEEAQAWLRPGRCPIPVPEEADALWLYGHEWLGVRSLTITVPDEEEMFSPAEIAAVLPVVRVYDAHLVTSADGAPAFVLLDGDVSEASP